MKLFLDDVRDPEEFGAPGWVWAKTAADAVKIFGSGKVTQASLDHDLTQEQMTRGGIYGTVCEDGQKSGYDVVLWLEEHPEYWPIDGVRVHSANPAGRNRMERVIERHYHCRFILVLGELIPQRVTGLDLA